VNDIGQLVVICASEHPIGLEDHGHRHENRCAVDGGAGPRRLFGIVARDWLLRSGWMAQELLATFGAELGSVTPVPVTGGIFEIRSMES
jgi:hypothetical protein